MTSPSQVPYALPNSARRHIGRRLEEARTFRGFEPASVDAALERHPGFIEQLEKGEGPIYAQELQLVMAHLNISVRFLYDGAPSDVVFAIEKAISSGHKPGSLTEIIGLLKGLSVTV